MNMKRSSYCFSSGYRFKYFIFALLIFTVCSSFISIQHESPKAICTILAEDGNTKYEKDARQIASVIAEADMDMSCIDLLKKYGITDPELIGNRLVLKTVKNNRGQEIILEALVELSKESLADAELKGFNVIFRNDLKDDYRKFYSDVDFSEMYSALTEIINTKDSPDKTAKRYAVYSFWDMCCNAFSFTIEDKYWEEASYIGVSK